jgi:hypothetical protein
MKLKTKIDLYSEIRELKRKYNKTRRENGRIRKEYNTLSSNLIATLFVDWNGDIVNVSWIDE